MSKQLLGCRIRYMRKRSKFSQENLAELLGIDPNSVSRIECGVHYPSLDTLEKISNILNVEMHEFFQFRGTDNVREMRTFLIQTASEIGEEKLDEVVRVIRQVV
jgi:transcriptional regulator with XRE-family HTH domain